MQKKRITTTLLIGILSEIINKIVPIALINIASRRLGIEIFGKTQFAIYLVDIFIPFITWGYSAYASIVIGGDKDNKKVNGQLIGTVITTRLVQAVIVFICLTTLVFSIDQYKEYRVLALSISFVYLTTALENLFVLVAIQKLFIMSLLNIVIKTISLVCIYLYVTDPSDALTYLLLSYGANGVIALGTSIIGFNYYRWHKTDLSQIKTLLKKGVPFALTYILIYLFDKMDLLIVEYLQDAKSLGYFAGIFKLYQALIPIVLMVMGTFFSEMVSEKSRKKQEKMVALSFWGINSVIFPIIVGSWFVYQELIPLLIGEQFSPATYLFPLIIPSLFSFAIIQVIGNQGLVILGYVKQLNIILLISVPVSICIMLIGGNHFGLPGIAIASSISKLIMGIAIGVFYLSINRSFPFRELLYPLAAAIGMAIFLLIIIDSKSAIINIIAGGISYSVLFLIFNRNLIKSKILT